MKQSTINRIRKFSSDRDWGQYHTAPNIAKSIAIEAAELLECYQWSDEADIEHVKEELADVIVYCQNMLDCLHLDVDAIVNSKMTKNEAKYPVEKARGSSKKYTELEDQLFMPSIDLDTAMEQLKARKTENVKYMELLDLAENIDNPEFQRKFTYFYRLRRDEEWRGKYYALMKDFQGQNNIDFGMIQLRLWQATGNIESSFSSKMLATLDPSKPIWDANVLKMLRLKAPISGTPEKRMSLAVLIYDKICRWYEGFMKTGIAAEMITRFDRELPEMKEISAVKKIDFILWAGGAQ